MQLVLNCSSLKLFEQPTSYTSVQTPIRQACVIFENVSRIMSLLYFKSHSGIVPIPLKINLKLSCHAYTSKTWSLPTSVASFWIAAFFKHGGGDIVVFISSHKPAKLGLPWWRSGWESACQCRAHGFEPWSGKIPQAAEQLGPWATITEPARLEPVLRNRRGRDGERPAHRDEEWSPLATTRESPRTETKTQYSHK